MGHYAASVTITVERPGGKDRFGDRLPSTTHTVSDCVVYPTQTDEVLTQRDTVIDEWTMLAPDGADILSSDIVLIPGSDERFEVDGKPGWFHSPFSSWAPGTKVHLRAVKG